MKALPHLSHLSIANLLSFSLVSPLSFSLYFYLKGSSYLSLYCLTHISKFVNIQNYLALKRLGYAGDSFNDVFSKLLRIQRNYQEKQQWHLLLCSFEEISSGRNSTLPASIIPSSGASLPVEFVSTVAIIMPSPVCCSSSIPNLIIE